MNMKMIAGACLCATAIVGCVSVDGLQTQMQSGEQSQIADAKTKITQIITRGQSGLSTFKVDQRKRCAELVSESDHAVEIIVQMSEMSKWAPPRNATLEEEEACRGLREKANHQVLTVLLKKVNLNDAAAAERVLNAILATGEADLKDVTFDIVRSMSNKETLEKLQAECSDYRSYKNYELRMQLHDNCVVLSRLLEVLGSQQAIADWFVRYATERNKARLSIGDLTIDAVLKKVTDEKTLFSLANFTLTKEPDGISASKFYDKITDEKLLAKFAIDIKGETYWDEKVVHAGERAVEKIKGKEALIELAFLAKHHCIRGEAKRQLDASTYVAGLAQLIKEKKLTPEQAKNLVEGLEDNQATVELYDSISNAKIKSVAFGKLCEKDRKFLRNRNRAACEKRIADAKVKAKDTFELGGFYLGMNISEVDDLVGYYCPEWSNSEDYVDDDKTIRGLWVPQQKGAFCRAGKDGKVFEFNFGKNFLKNFYKFDVQNEREWAAAYSRKEGVDLRYAHLSEDVKVADYNDPGVPYHALYSQDTYTYKNNSKDYRITYFGEQKISAGNGLVKQEARLKMQYVGGQQGMLRVRIEKD